MDWIIIGALIAVGMWLAPIVISATFMTVFVIGDAIIRFIRNLK